MLPIVYLCWEDSASTGEWSEINENGLDRIETIGFIVYEDETQIQISHSVDEFKRYCGILAIPKSVITKRITISPPKQLK